MRRGDLHDGVRSASRHTLLHLSCSVCSRLDDLGRHCLASVALRRRVLLVNLLHVVAARSSLVHSCHILVVAHAAVLALTDASFETCRRLVEDLSCLREAWRLQVVLSLMRQDALIDPP